MKEKYLHELKLSEAQNFFREPYGDTEWISLEDLKQWAIAIVKTCHDCKTEYVDKWDRCPLCLFLIDRFELTEEDLK